MQFNRSPKLLLTTTILAVININSVSAEQLSYDSNDNGRVITNDPLNLFPVNNVEIFSVNQLTFEGAVSITRTSVGHALTIDNGQNINFNKDLSLNVGGLFTYNSSDILFEGPMIINSVNTQGGIRLTQDSSNITFNGPITITHDNPNSDSEGAVNLQI